MLDPSPRAVMNHLIESCRDAERGFRHAATLVTHWTMRSEFRHAADLRAQCAINLLPHAHRLGGAATAEGTAAASMHRHWMDAMSLLSRHEDRSILTEARRGDSVTVLAFKNAVAGELPATVRDLVELEYLELCQSHERLAELDRVIRQGT